MAKMLIATQLVVANLAISSTAMMIKGSSSRSPVPFVTDNLTAWGSEFVETNTSQRQLILGIGFPKCGSHHTWEVFSRHPDTVTGYQKELKYFESPRFSPGSLCRSPSDEFYYEPRHLTEAEIYVKACYGPAGGDPTKKLLEFSPGYAGLRDNAQARAVERLWEVGKDMSIRMIVLVRDPVQRATSEINMFRDYGTVSGSDDELSTILHHQLFDFGPGRGYQVYAGEYADSLQYWLDNFPREQLLVVNTGALNEITTWRRMFKHVGLSVPSDDWLQSVISSVASNGRKEKATYMKLSENVEAELKHHYAPHDEKLWNLLGAAPWW